MIVAFFDTKSYDRSYFAENDLEFQFFDCRLSAQTANLAQGTEAVCAFVNDVLDEECLTILAQEGIRHVALRCAGYNNVDLAAADRLGIQITRVPAYSPHAVAEHTLALLLTLNRKIHRAYNRVREHNFSLAGLVGFNLHGKTVGIVGAGKIGQIAAQIFRGFGCRVLAYDIAIDHEWAERHGIEETSLPELLTQADIISLHLPLTPKTHHLIDEEAFRIMKPGAYLINTGRGKLIDTTALISSLKREDLAGVALDVYEEEEGIFFEDLSNTILKDEELTRLLTFPNVLLTSHQAFLTDEALQEIAATTCENLLLGNRDADFLPSTEVSQQEPH